ncbi:MAG: ornithine carbamoyltransferase [Actinobacteria bacterium]|nr:ornithine carbamoyltransferase [Actinomycetota bacterium]
MSRHLLDLDDLSASELSDVLDLSEQVDLGRPLAGRGVALLFEKPSTRTRHSTEMAVVQLGGHPAYVRADEVGIDERETAEDVARTLACYHATTCARVFDHTRLTRMAAASPVPVVNLLSDLAHPVQALADLLTIRQELGRLAGVTLAWVGDWSNVARSLCFGAALCGLHVRVAAPDGYGPTEPDLERLVLAGAASVDAAHRAADAVKGADVVVTDAWYSMGQESEAQARRRAFEGFGVDAALMSGAASTAIFLHCLPAHRGEEVASEVLEGPHSRVWAEATNRMHTMRGLLAWLARQPGRP